MSDSPQTGLSALACARLASREDIRRAHLRHGVEPPPWVEDPSFDINHALVIEAARDGRAVGLAEGVCFPGASMAMLHLLRLDRGFRTADNIRALAAGFVKAARDAAVRTISWRYEAPGDRDDPRPRLLRALPGIEVGERTLARLFCIDFRSMRAGNARLSDYTEDMLARQGIRLIRLRDADKALLDEVRAVCADPDGEAHSLSPLEGAPYDAQNSMLWVRADTGALCGWMAVRRQSADTVELARNYTLPDVRSDGVGISFNACMMRRLSDAYAFATVRVLEENRSMLFFIRRFFGAYASESSLKLITLNLL